MSERDYTAAELKAISNVLGGAAVTVATDTRTGKPIKVQTPAPASDNAALQARLDAMQARLDALERRPNA